MGDGAKKEEKKEKEKEKKKEKKEEKKNCCARGGTGRHRRLFQGSSPT